MRMVAVIVLFGVMSSTAACAPEFQHRLPDAPALPSPILVLPPVVTAVDLEAGGARIDQPERAKAIAHLATPEVLSLARAKGVTAVPSPRGAEVPDPTVREALADLREWGANAAMEITRQMQSGRNPYNRTSVGHWQSERRYGMLRHAFQVDYALVVFVREARESNTRAFVRLGTRHWRGDPDFRQVGAACIVNLTDSRMLWCHTAVNGTGDLRTPDDRQELLKLLLSDLTPGTPPR